MDTFGYFLHGFTVALQPTNLLFVFLGALLGTIIGILPGIGATAGIALLLPLTYGLDPIASLIMLTGIYYGSSYGGTAASVLINTPGDGTSVITVFDGYPMAQKGRAGAALAVAAVGSFVAGTLSVVALTLLAVPLSSVALRFGPAENFMLMAFTMTAVGAFTSGSLPKGLLSAFVGLMIATVGIDLQSAQERFTFGAPSLQEGVPFLSVVVGFFALAGTLEQVEAWYKGDLKPIRIEGRLWCTPEEWRRSVMPITRGSIIGFLIGVLPGAGGIIATIMSYAVEKRLSKHPEEFGKGAIEGVAGPEAANNAATSGNLVPLLTLGIPGSGMTAVLLGAFIMFGIQPGPQLMTEQPDLVWGLINSMYVGNVILVILNLPLIGLFVRILYLPPGVLIAGILLIALTGVYSVNGSLTEVYLALGFAVVGYFFRRMSIPVAPLVLGVVLGGLMEQSFRQGMTISGGNPSIFLSTTVCLILGAMTAASLLFPLWQQISLRRRTRLLPDSRPGRVTPPMRRGVNLLLPVALVTGAVIASHVTFGSSATGPAVMQAGRDIISTIPRLGAAIILAAFVQVWIPQGALAAWFGQASGLKGLAVAGALGSVTVGGPMTSFPLIATLTAAGAEVGCVVAFLTGWSLLAVQRILVWELPLLGPDFVLVRILSCLLLPILAGLLMRALRPARADL